MRLSILWILSTYVLAGLVANAQDFDPTINLGNQIDQNVSRTLEAQSQAPVTNTEANPAPPAASNQTASNKLVAQQPPSLAPAPNGITTNAAPVYPGETGSRPSTFLNPSLTKRYYAAPVYSQTQAAPVYNTIHMEAAPVPAAAPINGGNVPYSGFTTNAPTAVQYKTNAMLFQETFTEKNSYTGMGVTDGFATQIGTDISNNVGTDIQPNLSYQYAARDRIGTTTYRADTYSATLGITQKVFPFKPLLQYQGGATYNLGDPEPGATTYEANGQKYIADVYPSFDANLSFNAGANEACVFNLGKGSWAHTDQHTFALAPGLVFNFYLKRLDKAHNHFSLIPTTISIAPTYTDQMTMVNNGTSSSAGILTIQDRNSYYWVFDDDLPSGDVTVKGVRYLQVTESNTLYHDTNQEAVTTPVSPYIYQNWAKFALGVTYQYKPGLSGKVEYTYEAFNNMYDSQTVVASCNFKF